MRMHQELNDDSLKQATPVSGRNKPCESEGGNTAKIDSLIANLDSRLIGGRGGEWCVEGSRLTDDKHHTQLKLVFELKEALMAEKKHREQEAHRIAAADEKQAKPAGKANANIVETIKNVVEQQLTDKLRDLNIQNGRLQEDLKKAQSKIDDLETASSNDNKAKKAILGPKGLDARVTALENTTTGQSTSIQGLENRVRSVEATSTALQTDLDELENDFDELETNVEQINDTYATKTAMNNLVEAVNKNAAKAKRTCEYLRNQVEALQGQVDDSEANGDGGLRSFDNEMEWWCR